MKNVVVALLLTLVSKSSYGLPQDSIRGLWILPQDGTLIEVDIKNNTLEGFIARRPPDHNNELDLKNPDPELRSQPILGLRVLNDLKSYKEDHWVGGRAYDPDSGSTYRAQAQLVDQNTLAIRGYIGIPLLGRTALLRRYKN